MKDVAATPDARNVRTSLEADLLQVGNTMCVISQSPEPRHYSSIHHMIRNSRCACELLVTYSHDYMRVFWPRVTESKKGEFSSGTQILDDQSFLPAGMGSCSVMGSVL